MNARRWAAVHARGKVMIRAPSSAVGLTPPMLALPPPDKPLSLYPLSFEDALRGLLAVGPAPSKAPPAKAHQKR